MADRFAVPSSDNWDWGSTGSWSATDGGSSGAAVPANTNDVYVKQGAYSLGTSNLDQSAVTLNSLSILPGYGGDRSGLYFPTGSNPLLINATTLTVASERVKWINLSGAFGTINVRQLRGGTFYLSGGSVTTFRGGATGNALIGDDVEATLVESAGMEIEILADTSSPNDLEIVVSKAGKVKCRRKVSTGSIDGVLHMLDAATIAISSGNTKIVVNSGGKLLLNNSGAMDAVKCLGGGTVTTRGTPGFATPPTLATLVYHDGAIIDVPSNTLTITTKTPVGGFDTSPGIAVI